MSDWHTYLPRVKTLSVSYDDTHYATPTVENATNKSYPIVRPLYYYYNVKNKEQVSPLIQFILSSDGQDIIKRAVIFRLNKKMSYFCSLQIQITLTVMTDIKNEEAGEKKSLNFIEQAVEKDLKEGKNGGKVQTRFPPEPNGYLHIGHAKAICLDFGIAEKHGGVCNLRFDDTNPTKEDVEYVEAIKEDIQWLGYQWGNEYYASDYFQQLWDFAIRLIQEGKAYIDEQSSELIAHKRYSYPTGCGKPLPQPSYRRKPRTF